jgi:hypothetical protein
MFMCASELSLGVGLILTAGRAAAGLPATAVRAATALLFLTAVGALHELRTRRPDAGCGCFGDLSDTPVGGRTITRSALLSAAAVASVGVPPLRMPGTTSAAGLLIGCAALEIALLALLSPELGEILVRLGYSEPCEIRRLPVERTLAGLRSSAAWRRYRRQLTGSEPSDIWREGCWRFVVYEATVLDRPADIVFAVYLQTRRPPVRAAVLDARTGEPLPGGAPRPVRANPVSRPAARLVLAAPVPAPTFTPRPAPHTAPVLPGSLRTPAHHAADATAPRHAGFGRIIRAHTGTHQSRRRLSGLL